MNKAFSIWDIIKICLKKFFYIISGAVLGALIFYVMSAFIIKPSYVSSAEFYIYNPGSVGSSSGINAYDLQAAQKISNTYIAVLKGNVVTEQIKKKLEEKYDIEQLKTMMKLDYADGQFRLTEESIQDCIDIEAIDSTQVVQISVKTYSPILSVELCRWYVEIGENQVSGIVGKGEAKSVGGASFPLEPDSPDLLKNTLLGLAAGGVFAVILVFLAQYFDNKITTKEMLQKEVDINVLGEIPDYKG